ncbi:MAG: hypothetical protein JXA04_07160 [Gammaproteobacteria bacterium]|nr:hypothetical protein [Gammaproteobacteria bacterium]
MTVPGLSQVSQNLVVTWSHKLVSVFVTFFITGIATRALGLETMGLWVIAMSVAAYMQVLDLGVASALPRILPRLKAAGDDAAVARSVSVAIIITTVFGALGLLVSPGVAWFVSGAYDASMYSQETLFWLIFAALIISALVVPFRLGFGLLATGHRFDIYFAIEIVGLFLKFAAVFIVLHWLGGGIIAYGITVSLIPLMSSATQTVSGLRVIRPKLSKPLRWHRQEAATMLSSCGAALLMTLAGTLHIQGGNLIAANAGAKAAALVGYPMMLIINAMSFSGSLGAFLTPIASGLKGAAEEDRLSRITVSTVRGSFAIAILIGVVLLVSGRLLLQLWLGDEVTISEDLDQMNIYLQVLLIGGTLLIPSLVAKGMLMSTGWHWHVAIVDFTGAAIGLSISVLAMTFFGLDIFVWVLGITMALRGLLGVSWLAARECRLSYWSYVRQTMFTPLVAGAIAWITANVASVICGGWDDILQVIFKLSMVSVIWFAVLWIFILEEDFRVRLVGAIKSKIENIL